MARVRTIVRHVHTCLTRRVESLVHADKVADVFGTDDPTTDVPGDGVSLIRWAYKAHPEERDTSLIARIGTTNDYFYRAGMILSSLMSWRPRVQIHEAHRLIGLWVRDNVNNLGGEPYQESHRAELRTEVYYPPPPKKPIPKSKRRDDV